MSGLDHILTCLLVTEDDINNALPTRAGARALVEKMAAVARPNQGATRILAVLASMTKADWLDGALRVEIGGDAEMCVIDVMSELGGGFSERVWPAMAVAVPLDEVRRAVKMQPKFILPLQLKHDRASRLVFSVDADRRFSSLPPPVIKVGEESLIWGEKPPPSVNLRMLSVPQVDDDGWDEAITARNPLIPTQPAQASTPARPPSPVPKPRATPAPAAPAKSSGAPTPQQRPRATPSPRPETRPSTSTKSDPTAPRQSASAPKPLPTQGAAPQRKTSPTPGQPTAPAASPRPVPRPAPRPAATPQEGPEIDKPRDD